MDYNLADLFESVVDAVPGREALVHLDHPGDGAEHRLTYAGLDEAANRLAHHLRDSGVRPGEHVGLHLYNGVGYLQALWACLKIRAVPVNVNYRYVAGELAYLYRDAGLTALVFDGEFTGRVAAALPGAPTLRHLVRAGAPPAGAPEPAVAPVPLDEAEASGAPWRDFGPRSGDDRFIVYTGGTTGMPKGVLWRQEDLFFAGLGGGAPTGEPVKHPGELAERVAAGGEGLVFLPAAPLMHGTSTLTALIAFGFGQKVVLHRKFVPAEVLRTVAKERVTSVSLVGDAMLRPLVDALAGPLRGTDCSSLLTVSSSGAILSDAVREEFTALLPGVALLNNFGSSESGFNGTATEDRGRGFRLRVNGRTAVVDPVTHEPVPPGTPGRVAQRGHVPLGYHNDPAKTAETFFRLRGERWVLLGDMATVDAEGVVTVLGRGSQCINTGGEKVYPEEVEQALKAHPDVYDALVTGVPDPRWGQRVTAVVQPREGTPPPSPEALRAHCRDRLAGYKVPRGVVYTDRVRRSPSGKADYRWAKEVAEGGG
ncbi:acyl-CoA synthetase [Streptomyces eurocidicus]|uniref:Acyl-CoA synthetase n=1 Tax=Streptomyces eurocidicus TaxID=66423 RepID=A0A2N8NQ45_STREU|nr:acyl-CoA synthetase [Streptomyces eurocidicus]MBB5122322.1 acyl-CoA synthetase (AMP-forming)/AMP-acid ligase II [Streptomyces eurocidicus]MBF6051608.1 AMP-binding protein [Streptomyces eurocidicus]PNE30895.1 acyl-CoA synthetase [Streptomyces eurocidicus]